MLKKIQKFFFFRLNSLETGNYKIHATFIRLLYTLDKIDLAIEYFKDEVGISGLIFQ